MIQSQILFAGVLGYSGRDVQYIRSLMVLDSLSLSFRGMMRDGHRRTG
jgi:hypothetical protein